LILGHWLRTGQFVEFAPESVARQIPLYLWDWIAGSIILAALVGLLGGCATYLIARAVMSRRKPPAP